jgi:peptidoglycan/LPS O-acetylase OafA/YrhL
MKSRIETPMLQTSHGWNLARLRRITTASHRYMAEVDGLRFIAIFSVMLFHVFYMASHVPGVVLANSSLAFLLWPVTQGFRGVQLFFVISGFILGLPFAAQHLTHGPPVKIGRFYVRRLTRLEPPYILALLMFYVLAILMHNVHTREPGFLSGLPLRLGYAYLLVRGTPPTLDGVTWTLEIEVQFYLLAPLLAQVFKLATSPRRLTLIAAICGAPLLARVVPGSDLTLLGFFQYFLTGFLLADIHCTGAGAGRLPRWLYDLVGIGCLLGMALAPETPDLMPFLPWLLGGLFIGALRGGWLNSVLRRPSISVLGGMCYSLYLLHNPLLSFIAAKIIHNGMSLPQAYLRLGVVGLPIVTSAGIAYYILIERPCMNPNWPQTVFQHASKMIGAGSKSVRPLTKSNQITARRNKAP